MGAVAFMTSASGRTPQDAFAAALRDAAPRGARGTIAAKDSFLLIQVPGGLPPQVYAEALLSPHWQDFEPWPPEKVAAHVTRKRFMQDALSVHDKSDPAGCVPLGDGAYLFFGYARD